MRRHHGFFFGHLEVGVDGGDDEVESGKDVTGIVEGAVAEDIALDAFEDDEGCEFPVEVVDLGVLFAEAVFFEAIGIEGGLAVIADDEVLKAFFDAGGGHFFEGVGAVGPFAVAMDDGADIGCFDVRGSGWAALVQDDALFAAVGRDKGQVGACANSASSER